MAVISNQQRQPIRTFVEDADGIPVRCRKASDSELAKLLEACDEWVISAPDLRRSSTAVKTLDRRLRALQLCLANPGDGWCVGMEDDFNLTAERLDWMLEHGRELFIGSSPRIDRNGSTREVGVIALGPYECQACDIVIDLQRT